LRHVWFGVMSCKLVNFTFYVWTKCDVYVWTKCDEN
jgi:hypothetical protein